MSSFNSSLRNISLICTVSFLALGQMFAQSLSLTFSANHPTCHNFTNGIATVTVSGGTGNYQYLWDNGQAGSSNFGLNAGTYSVTVTDWVANSTATGSVTLTHPTQLVSTINPPNGNCGTFDGNLTTSVSGGTGAYTYNWSNGATSANQTNLPVGGYFLTVTDANGCSDVDFQSIAPLPNMFANFLITRPLCAGDANASISNVSVFGNYPPFTYSWPNGVSNQNLTGVAAGTYNLVMTDNNGCTVAQPITIQDQTPLTIVTEKEDSKCAMTCDGVVKVYPTGGVAPYQVLWSNGSTNMVVFPLPPGIYTVTVTDANGCSQTGSEEILEPTPIVLDIVSQTGACGGNTGSLTLTASGGVPPFKYTWNNGQTGPTLSNVPAGTYYVIVEDANGCQKSLPYTINGAGGLNVTLATTSALCAGQNDGTASAIVTQGSGNYSYTWNVQGSPNTSTINGISANTNLAVTVTDVNTGCEGSATAYIGIHQQVLVTINPSNVLCATDANGAAIAIGANGTAPYSYVWNIGGTTVTGPTVSGLSVGAYQVTATDANGCTSANVANITNTDQVQANYSFDVAGCDNDNLGVTLIDASAGATAWQWNVVWSTGAQQFSTQSPGALSLSDGETGTIQLTVTSAAGCTSSVSQPFAVEGEGIDISLSASQLTECEGNPLTISATNNTAIPVTYQWFSNQPGLTITNGTTNQPTINGGVGNYSLFVIATAANGCKDTLNASVSYTSGQSLANAIAANTCNGLEVLFTNSTTIPGVWNFGDGTTSTSNDPTHTYTSAGPYTITFEPSVSCVSDFDTTLTVLPAPAVNASFQAALQSCDSIAVFNYVNTSTSSAAIASYAWNLGQNNTSTSPNPTVTYLTQGPITAILTVTDVNGCIDTANITLPFHIINEQVDNAQEFCVGPDAVALNPVFNSTYDYVWTATPTDPNLVSNSPNPIVNPAVPTTYQVVITLGGCQVQRSVLVTPNAAAQLTSPNDVNTCLTDPINLTASSSNGTILWANNPSFTNPQAGTNYTAQPTASGFVYVQAITAAGCLKTDTIAINAAPVNINYDSAVPACAGDDITLAIQNADPADQLIYQWSNNLPAVSNPTLTPSGSGTYTATVSNQFGCSAVATFNVTYTSLSVSVQVTGKDTICPGETTKLLATTPSGGSFTFDWSPATYIVNGDGTAEVEVNPSQSETFSVTITDANGCSATGSSDVAFRALSCARPFIFMPSAFTPNGDTNNDKVMVRGLNIEKLMFVIYDRWGEKVFTTENPSDQGWDGTYNGKELTPDSYGYYFRVECVDGETYEEKGNVTLLK